MAPREKRSLVGIFRRGGEELDNPRRMEVWYADIPRHDESSIQGGCRPVVIVSNDICNSVSTVLTVAPMTRRMKKLSLPTHVVIEAPDGKKSVVLAEQIMPIDKSQLVNKMGNVNEEDVKKIEIAMKEQLGMKGELNEQHYNL